MKKDVPDDFSIADLLRNPNALRDLLRETRAVRNLRFVDSTGVERHPRWSPRDGIVDLGPVPGNPSALVPPLPQSGFYASLGGTITQVGDYRIHIFTTSGTLQVTRVGNARVLLVAGGGGGGTGGGGAGGLIELPALAFASAGPVPVVVGTGGAHGGGLPNVGGFNGTNSTLNGQTAIGGGGGGAYNTVNGEQSGKNGGSGGGGGTNIAGVGSGGTGTVGQGHNGAGVPATGTYYGGGGGAGTAGTQGTDGISGSGVGGNGGTGVSSDITGATLFYAGGGGGMGANVGGGLSGSGVGGTGTYVFPTPHNSVPPVANRGGGGGGGRDGDLGSAGADGVVIVAYLNEGASIPDQIGNTEIPNPEDDPEETDCEACSNTALVDDVTGDVMTDDVTGNIMTDN